MNTFISVALLAVLVGCCVLPMLFMGRNKNHSDTHNPGPEGKDRD